MSTTAVRNDAAAPFETGFHGLQLDVGLYV
jgi:hypothetical protein